MTEWGVFLVIGSLLAFLAAVVPPLMKLNTSIVTLTLTMSTLEKNMTAFTSDNAASHKRAFDGIEQNGKDISKLELTAQNHEGRITALEKHPHTER